MLLSMLRCSKKFFDITVFPFTGGGLRPGMVKDGKLLKVAAAG